MLVQLGARRGEQDLVDLLLECHTRIRNFLAIARRLPQAGDLEERRTAASQVHRYFTSAFPLHLEDEDVLAREVGCDNPSISGALATMQADHADHAAAIERLVHALAQIMRDPANRSLDAELLAATERVDLLLEPHLLLEEREIFPVLRLLPEAVSMQLRAGMRKRREVVLQPRA